MIKKILFLLCFLIPYGTAAAETAFEDLSLQEKLGQTLVVFTDIDSAEIFRPAIQSGQIGGVLVQWGNYSFQQTQALIKKLQGWAAQSPHKIPLLIAIDYEGGTVYTPITLGFDYLPTNMMLSAADDEATAASLAYLAGQELRRAGIHMNFSPVLDVNSNPSNPIIGVRSFGSDPANVTKMGLALMNGFKAAGIISVVKHFPGHGDTAEDSHYQVPVVKTSYQQLNDIHLLPFRQAVEHGVQGIMTGHVLYPALDNKNIATFSRPILQDLLRTQMGFKGLLVTDSLDMKATTTYCTIADCAIRSLAAGADLVLLGRYIKPQATINRIYKQIEQNPLGRARVEEAARKIFELKQTLGLLGEPSASSPTDKAYQSRLLQISQKAVTLVRNRTQRLPVRPSFKQPTLCAVFFAPSRFSDQLTGFSQPFLQSGWKVRSYNAAMNPKELDERRAAACAQGADLLVVTSLQWADKTNLGQKRIIKSLLTKYPSAVLISTMSPYDISAYPEANTLLATYGLNRYVLQTAAQIILGQRTAQGSLPVTLPSVK